MSRCPSDHSPDQLQIFRRVYADRAVSDGDDLDPKAMLQGAHLFEHFALFEWSRGEFGVRQQEVAAVGVKAGVSVERPEQFRTGAQRRPDRTMFQNRRARKRDRVTRETDREPLAVDYDFDHVRFERVFDRFDRLAGRAHDDRPVGEQGLEGGLDRRRLDQRLVALNVDDDLGVQPRRDFGKAVGPRRVIRRRHDRLDSRAGDGLKDAFVVRRDDHATDRSRLFGAFDDAQNHRFSADLYQWFAWQSGRGVAGGNDCDDVVSHKSVAGADPAGPAKYMPSAECFKTSGFLFFRRVFNICRRLPTSYPHSLLMGFATKAIHTGQEPDPATGAIITPIYQTSTYVQEALGRHKGFEYARTQNPTRAALERNLAALEGGFAAHCFASGMSAIDTVLKLLEAGDHVVVTNNTYGGTYRLFDRVLRNFGLEFSYVDTSDVANVEAALRENTRMVFIETVANPTMVVADLEGIGRLTRDRSLRLVVDNTFLSPFFLRPIEWGADIVAHSMTKYLNGHCDSVGGVVITTRPEDAERIGFLQNAAGAILSPFDSFLILRGTKTLALRMKQHDANGRVVASFL